MDLLSAQKCSGLTTTAVLSVRAAEPFMGSAKLLQTDGYVVLMVLCLISLIFVSLAGCISSGVR